MRVRKAPREIPSVNAGRMRKRIPPLPEMGKRCQDTENARISRMPRRKPGRARPAAEKIRASASQGPFFLKAAMMASGKAMAMDISMAARVKPRVFGRYFRMEPRTGLRSTRDSPRSRTHSLFMKRA